MISLTASPTLASAGTVSFGCTDHAASDHVEDVMLTAMQVETITPQ